MLNYEYNKTRTEVNQFLIDYLWMSIDELVYIFHIFFIFLLYLLSSMTSSLVWNFGY